jgi:hypothetical protein
MADRVRRTELYREEDAARKATLSAATAPELKTADR